jgi:hypothetical protein
MGTVRREVGWLKAQDAKRRVAMSAMPSFDRTIFELQVSNSG